MHQSITGRIPRALSEREIQDALLEDIPSDGESVFSVESDEEYNDGPQTVMALGDSPPQQPGLEDEFGSDDEDILLPELVSTSDGHVPTSSASTSSNRTVVAEPKWKKNVRRKGLSEYTEGGGIPYDIIDLVDVTATQLFR
ncbi:hypothetical protein HHI36_010563 [Cryptolaemus montrouzieri]|uniref:Uncharacterized protein n=1 Tax=Cryptolaemus montrouzieri TaxID=559131 RepID=A0ABD2MJ07_9CUCU